MIDPSIVAGRRFLVTGATSFIGSRLCERLDMMGAEVYAFVRFPPRLSSDDRHHPNIKYITASMEQFGSAITGLPQIDVVYHLAWAGVGSIGRADPSIQASNYHNSMRLLSATSEHGCNLFVFGGSQAEYGQHNNIISESAICKPQTEYGKAKLAVTTDGAAFCQAKDMSYRMTRIFSVFGPGDHPWTLTSALINALKNNEKLPLTDCRQNWNYLFLDDAVDALITLADQCPNGIYNIASTVSKPLREYVDTIYAFFPNSGKPGYGLKGESNHLSLEPCVSKLISSTPWRESFTFEQGIQKTIQSFS